MKKRHKAGWIEQLAAGAALGTLAVVYLWLVQMFVIGVAAGIGIATALFKGWQTGILASLLTYGTMMKLLWYADIWSMITAGHGEKKAMNGSRQRAPKDTAPGPAGRRAFHGPGSGSLETEMGAPIGNVSAWKSMLAAASEEVGDDTGFEFQVSLPAGRAYEHLAKAILTRGADAPALKMIVQEVAAEFQITEKESLRAVDRALGGMFRAMTGKTEARPSDTGDPVATAAFDLCVSEPQRMEALWPGWQKWVNEVEQP